MSARSVFFVSDGTAITAEMLGQSVLLQFAGLTFDRVRIPFVNSVEKAMEVAPQINEKSRESGVRPIVFGSFADPDVSEIIAGTDSVFFDCLSTFIVPLERELGVESAHTTGLSHSARDFVLYHERIEAINFTLGHDDGLGTADLDQAEIVLVGVSRSGKTPSSLYMAMQFGIRAGNYPLTPEDLEKGVLPPVLEPCQERLYGLTIDPKRLHQIRDARRSNSPYASMSNCIAEVRDAERIFERSRVPVFDTTTRSIEEICTMIIQRAGLSRRVY